MSTLAPELSGKRLELLKEIVPKLSRVGVLGASTQPGYAALLKEMELAAEAFKVKLQYLDVLDPKDIETAFRAASKGRADAVLTLSSPVITSHRSQVADLAVKNRLPAIYPQTEYIEAGGLMSYGANTTDLFRRAATYVDKILKGAKPADLPVEQPIKFELVINLKAAKQIGLTIPPNVLARADRVIRVNNRKAQWAKSKEEETRRNHMRKNIVRLTASGALLLALSFSAEAQQAARISRIGILIRASASFYFGPGRSISPTAARAWLCRRKKHCH